MKDEFPEVYTQLHPTLNADVDLQFAEHVTFGSARKLWWLCPADHNRPAGCTHEHAWQATVFNRCGRNSSGCPFCSGLLVCPCNSMATKVPSVVAFWHFDKNTRVDPQEVGPSSKKRVWWHHTCPTTGEEHEWQANVGAFVCRYMVLKAAPCPACAKRANKERLAASGVPNKTRLL